MELHNTKNDKRPIINISVIGVGGAGNNTLENIPKNMFPNVKFIFANTDKQVLEKFNPDDCIYLNTGDEMKDGLGAGANPEIGKLAAKNSINKIRSALANTRLLILTAGLGGGTGTGASPIIAKIAKEMGILTIAIVTTPFAIEGPKRKRNAIEGLKELKENIDSIIVVSNDKLVYNYPDIALKDAFQLTNNVLKNCVKTFTDLILKPSIINLDFSDLSSIIKEQGEAYIGFGKGVGKNKIRRAIDSALKSKIIETPIKGSKNAILNIVADSTVSISQVHNIIDILKQETNENLNVIFGFNIDEKLRNEVQISIVTTFDTDNQNQQSKNDDSNLKTQELLLQIKNTLELELNNQSKEHQQTELDLDQKNQFDDKDQEEIFIKFEENEDDDIPFFLK